MRTMTRAAAFAVVTIVLAGSAALATAPANDDFASRQTISGATGSVTGSNVDATPEDTEPCPAANCGGVTVWYQYVTPSAGDIVVTTAGSGFDTTLGIYTGNSLVTLQEQGSNNDDGTSVTSRVALVGLASGTSLKIVVDGLLGETGAITLNWTLTAAPANDPLSGAAELSGASGSVAGTVVAATLEPNEPCPLGICSTASVWYSWQAPSAGILTVDTFGSTLNTILSTYTGSTMTALATVGESDDASGGQQSRVIHDVVSGTTYRIRIADQALPTAAFTVNWSFAAAPTNDNFASAEAISGASGNVSGSNVNGSIETSEPCAMGHCEGRSVWYAWTAPSSGRFAFETCTRTVDTVVGIYTGASFDALTEIGASNDYIGCGTGSRVVVNATGAVVYKIRIGGVSNASGTFTLRWDPAPGNDDVANATDLLGLTGSATAVSNRAASKEGGEPDHAGDAGGVSVWYRWLAPSTRTMEISTAGSTFDTTIGVYTGAPGALTTVASDNDSGEGSLSLVTFAATSGTTYLIGVDGFGGAIGTIALAWANIPPVNNAFTAGASITGASGTVAGTNVDATRQSGEPNHGTSAGAASIWYRWTAPGSGTITFDTLGSSFDTLLGVYTGSAVDALTTVGTNDDESGALTTSLVTFAAVSGTTYHIAIDGDGGALGTTVLTWYRIAQVKQETTARGMWRVATEGGTYGGTYQVERNAGAIATYVFSGRSVTWYTNTGRAYGRAKVLIDGRTIATVNNYTATNRRKVARTFTGLSSARHTMKIVVLGQRGASGGTDTLVAIDAMKPGTNAVQQNPSLVTSWRAIAASGASGGRYITNDLAGSSATFTFSGTGVDVVLVAGPAQGRAQIVVDGTVRATVDTYAASVRHGLRTAIRNLAAGAHTVQVVPLGTKAATSTAANVGVDKINVI